MKIRKPSKKTMALGLSVAMAGALCTPYIEAANLSKKIDAVYRNITVSFNGKTATLSTEPFINTSDNSVYVPLRAFSEMTGAQVVWDNANNRVSVTGVDTTAKDAEIASKNHEIITLRQKLSAAEEKLKQYENLNNGTTEETTPSLSQKELDEMTKTLIKEYGKENRVEWDFDLLESKGNLKLIISYDSRYDDEYFNKLSDKTLKTFVDDICYDIQKEFKGVKITGTIEDSRYDSVKANFEYSTSGKLTFESKAALYEDLIYDLERAYRYVEGISFDLPIEEISLEERNNTLIFTVLVNLKPDSSTDLTSDWNAIANSSSNLRKLEDFMFDIAYDIEREFDIDVEGYIRDEHSENIICSYDGRKVVHKEVR